MSAIGIQKCEEVARRVCAILGLDPDATVQMPNSTLLEKDGMPSMTDVPYWTLMAHQVPEQVAWFRAITEILFKSPTRYHHKEH